MLSSAQAKRRARLDSNSIKRPINIGDILSLTITLAVEDLDRSEQFYRDTLCLPVERINPGRGFPDLLLIRQGEGAALLLRQSAAMEASHPALFQHLDRLAKGIGVNIELTVADLDRVDNMVRRQQLHTLYDLEDSEHQRRELWLHDPDGYLLMLTWENPKNHK